MSFYYAISVCSPSMWFDGKGAEGGGVGGLGQSPLSH